MTDAARALYQKLHSQFLIHTEMAQQDITLIAQALAAAKREGMEEVAKGLATDIEYGPDDEAHDNRVGKDGDGTSYNQGVRACIKWCQDQAHAIRQAQGEEGNGGVTISGQGPNS